MEGFKKYEYNGKIYCDGISDKAIVNYGGNTVDLYMALKADGKAGVTAPLFYSKGENSLYYSTVKGLIEGEFSALEVK